MQKITHSQYFPTATMYMSFAACPGDLLAAVRVDKRVSCSTGVKHAQPFASLFSIKLFEILFDITSNAQDGTAFAAA